MKSITLREKPESDFYKGLAICVSLEYNGLIIEGRRYNNERQPCFAKAFSVERQN